MAFISAAQGQPYMNAVTSLVTKLGDWIPIGDGLAEVCFQYIFALGAGNVTGSILVEHTANMSETVLTTGTGTRVLLPLGSMHTTLTTATLDLVPNPSLLVTLTAVTTGKLSIMLSDIPPGQIRSTFSFASGTGASPNTITCYVTGRSK
jgi:hypothetical protein